MFVYAMFPNLTFYLKNLISSYIDRRALKCVDLLPHENQGTTNNKSFTVYY